MTAHAYGRISEATAQAMRANPARALPSGAAAADRHPSAHRRAWVDDGAELDEEFRTLWPARTLAETSRRARIAASASQALAEVEPYDLLFWGQP
jgi:hypothetical protein